MSMADRQPIQRSATMREDEKPTPVIEAIRRHFHLTEEHGITDKEFYGG